MKDMNKQQHKQKQMWSRWIKEELRIALLKKEEFERQKIEAAKAEFDRKIADEEWVIAKKEKEVMQMEMLEMELIKWL